MSSVRFNTTLDTEIKDGVRTITAYISVVDIRKHELVNTMTIQVGSEAELDEIYNRLELLYNMTQEEL